MIKRIIKTGVWTIIYCITWMVLELIIDGCITDRIVDDVIMLMFIPMIYKAMNEKTQTNLKLTNKNY